MGDITELGRIVAGAFAQPELAGTVNIWRWWAISWSFNEIIATLNRQGNTLSFKQVPREVFAGWSPGAEDVAAMLAYFEAHTYLGSDSPGAIALANKVSGRQPTKFAAWARTNFATPSARLKTYRSLASPRSALIKPRRRTLMSRNSYPHSRGTHPVRRRPLLQKMPSLRPTRTSPERACPNDGAFPAVLAA